MPRIPSASFRNPGSGTAPAGTLTSPLAAATGLGQVTVAVGPLATRLHGDPNGPFRRNLSLQIDQAAPGNDGAIGDLHATIMTLQSPSKGVRAAALQQPFMEAKPKTPSRMPARITLLLDMIIPPKGVLVASTRTGVNFVDQIPTSGTWHTDAISGWLLPLIKCAADPGAESAASEPGAGGETGCASCVASANLPANPLSSIPDGRRA